MMDYTDLTAMTAAIFNAIYDDPEIPKVECRADVEREGIPDLALQWQTIRLALEKMPDEVLTALCKLRGPSRARQPHLYVVKR